MLPENMGNGRSKAWEVGAHAEALGELMSSVLLNVSASLWS